MARLLFMIFCLFLIQPYAFGDELGEAGVQQTTEATGRGLDFSNVEPRDNVNLCSEQDLQERQEKQDQCVQRFGEMGITQTIRPHEVVEARSCDRIESFSEYLSGCAQFFLDMPGDAIGGVSALFGAGQYDQQIEQACGERPRQPIGASRRAARHGSGRISASERAQLNSYNSARETYNNCSNGIIEAAEQADAALEAQIAGYRTECRASFSAGGTGNQRRLARHGDRHIKGCMLAKAGRDNCDACISQLTEVPIGPRIINSVLDEFRKYRGFACYNKETQGRMVCAAIATAAGLPLGGAAASLAAKLPAAFRGAQAAARAPVSRMRAAADAADEAGEAASDIAAVQAGRVTEEALEANGALSDVDRVVEAQRLLGDRDLSPQQSRALIRAHEVGADRPGSGYGNYTQAELREKNRILNEAGFSTEDRRLLMDQGIVGRPANQMMVPTGRMVPNQYGRMVPESIPYQRPQGYPSTVTDREIREIMGNKNRLREDIRANPNQPNNSRLLAETIARDRALRGETGYPDEITDLYRAEARNLERNFRSSGPSPTNRDPERVYEAYSNYAAGLPPGEARDAAIASAAEYRDLYSRTDAYRREQTSLARTRDYATGSARISPASVHADDFRLLREHYQTTSDPVSRAQARAQMEALSAYAQQQGWNVQQYFAVPR